MFVIGTRETKEHTVKFVTFIDISFKENTPEIFVWQERIFLFRRQSDDQNRTLNRCNRNTNSIYYDIWGKHYRPNFC